MHLVRASLTCVLTVALSALGPVAAAPQQALAASTASTSTGPVVAAGYESTCSLSAGRVSCWGDVGFASPGDPPPALVPQPVRSLSGVTAVALSYNQACAVYDGGRVACWGSSVTTGAGAPVALPGLTDAVAIAAEEFGFCAVRRGGSVSCWGQNAAGWGVDSAVPVALPGVSGATSIAGGGAHFCAVVTSGAVQCWGMNWQGQLGNGTNANFSASPTRVSGLTGAVQVTAGWSHTCALLRSGSVLCWGDNSFGQLGTGDGVEHDVPAPVATLPPATQLAAPQYGTCARLATGHVDCWGDDEFGEVGDGFVTGLNRNLPVPVRGVSGVNQLAGGGLHVCGSLGTQTVECWGDNGYGALGNGGQPSHGYATKVAVANLQVASIDLGAFTFTPGQPVTLAAVVTNVGTATAVGSVLGVRFRVDGTTVAWNENDTSPLAPGESVVLTMTGGVSDGRGPPPPARTPSRQRPTTRIAMPRATRGTTRSPSRSPFLPGSRAVRSGDGHPVVGAHDQLQDRQPDEAAQCQRRRVPT